MNRICILLLNFWMQVGWFVVCQIQEFKYVLSSILYIKIIDLNSKSIITEFIGHNAPIYRIGQFHGSSEFYTIDTSGVVNVLIM